MKLRRAGRPHRQPPGRLRLWGVAAAVATALLAVLAAWAWLDRPPPTPREGVSLPPLARGGDRACTGVNG